MTGAGRPSPSAALRALLERPKYELIPMKGVEESAKHLPEGARVSVTVSPTKGIEATLELAEGLIGPLEPGHITPHISARLVESAEHLDVLLDRVARAGFGELFIVGGDASEPKGPYRGSYDLVRAIRERGSELRLGVTAYPEGHPQISAEVLERDLLGKQPHVQYMASQLCFSGRTIRDWLETRRGAGVTLPLQLGVAGAVDLVKLARVAARIGVGDSLRYLSKHTGTLFKLMGGYRPDTLLEDLGPVLGDPFAGVEALHIYTFNQVDKTEAWRRSALDELGAAA